VITRDPRAAQEVPHDLVVIGGGIYGCMLALEAARRGLRPLLLERDDFGQHTSGSWLRILHGGLRYLQSLDLRRHLESVRERRWFLRVFPDLVEPLPCLMPLYGRGLHRRPVLAAAFAANDLLSAHRNEGLRADRRLPRGRIISRAEALRRAPALDTDRLVGGALWHDAHAPRPERLLVEVLRWATSEGALAANYVEVVELLQDGRAVVGVAARDRVSGETLTFRSGVVVACAGPWSNELSSRVDRRVPDLFRPSLAFNVLFDRAPDFEGALAVTAPRHGARTYFLLPAHGGVLAGTYHAPLAAGTAPVSAPAGELVAAFAKELDDAIPGLRLGTATVRHVFCGQLPARSEGTVDLARREVIHEHGASGGPRGLISVSGVKFTVARAVAERTLRAIERLGHVRPTSRASSRQRPAHEVPEASELLALASRDAAAAGLTVRRIVAEEAVVMPEDLVWRRTDLALLPDPAGLTTISRLVREALQPHATDAP
jgi:glycerol-3-phosphate dehydrogenase